MNRHGKGQAEVVISERGLWLAVEKRSLKMVLIYGIASISCCMFPR